MNRTVPQATSDEIQLYRSTLYSLLRSTAEVKIRTLEGVHAGMNSLMHPAALNSNPDINAFVYSAMRLPECTPDIRLVILGQNADVFRQNGYPDLQNWQPVSAKARRRRCFYNGEDTLVCYIASRSDIEDVVPCLTSYQIEWNKMHGLLQSWSKEIDLASIKKGSSHWSLLAQTLNISVDDLERLQAVWRERFGPNLKWVHQKTLSISLRLLSGSYAQYMKATTEWFDNIKTQIPDIETRPLYFISSNTHSIPNILTGFAQKHTAELNEFIHASNDPDLQAEWQTIQNGQGHSNRENFLYYVLKKYQNTPSGRALVDEQLTDEKLHGITRINAENTFDVEAQIIDIKKLDPAHMDPRLGGKDNDLAFLGESQALILNIDYPLGLAAYNILATVSNHTSLRGIYSMGKSASLNAARGDVIIPDVCQDEHSHNTYLFNNCFCASDVTPFLNYGSVLDNQKAISVLGTFLQNAHLMDIFFSESFADVEMELGNFLSALYEATRPKRYPIDEIVNLHDADIDFGVLHYVSDTPMSKGKNLGAGTLSYFGMDSTYACSIPIIKRIFDLERNFQK